VDGPAAGPEAITVGIDIGGTKTLAIGVDAGGRVLGRVRMPSGYGAQNVIDAAIEATDRLRAELPGTRIDRIGIGIPGTVDQRTGEVQQALNLGLEHVALGAAIGEQAGVPVHVENDVNAAAFGAVATLGGDSIAYLNLGTGLATGLVLGGRLWRGVRGAAGEIGHVPIDPAGPECVCGQRGCLEVMASGSGIARQWGPGVPAAAELGALAAAGDPRAAAIYDRLVLAVASAVRLIVLAQDVERIVVGGGLAEALGEGLVGPVVAMLGRWEAESAFLASLAPAVRVSLAPADVPLAAIGAALAAVEADGADGAAALRLASLAQGAAPVPLDERPASPSERSVVSGGSLSERSESKGAAYG